MEILAFPDIKTRGNGQIGKQGCWQKKGMSGKLTDIDVSVRHVADMLPTFPTKPLMTGKRIVWSAAMVVLFTCTPALLWKLNI